MFYSKHKNNFKNHIREFSLTFIPRFILLKLTIQRKGKSKTNIVLALFLTILMFNSCSSVQKFIAESKINRYNAVEDKYLVDKFYILSPDGSDEDIPKALKKEGWKYVRLYYDDMLCLRKRDTYKPAKELLNDYLKYYVSTSLTDGVAKRYIKAVRSRGNYIKVYKFGMTSYMAKILPNPFDPGYKYEIPLVNMDNVLIEYDKNGNVVSALVRYHTIDTSAGYLMEQHACLYFGIRNAQDIENRLSNSVFKEFYLKTIKW